MRKILFGIVAAAFLAACVYTFSVRFRSEGQASAVASYKDAEYRIDGVPIRLKDGVAETETAPGSASTQVTRYFGNDYVTDLDSDGRQDVVFIVMQETGGSGIFYYVVAARNTEQGYVGSDGYLLGDRIAPQTIGGSTDPRHRNVIVVNFADRDAGEPMTVQPSIGKSIYLKLDVPNMQWGVVVPDFEGESR